MYPSVPPPFGSDKGASDDLTEDRSALVVAGLISDCHAMGAAPMRGDLTPGLGQSHGRSARCEGGGPLRRPGCCGRIGSCDHRRILRSAQWRGLGLRQPVPRDRPATRRRLTAARKAAGFTTVKGAALKLPLITAETLSPSATFCASYDGSNCPP